MVVNRTVPILRPSKSYETDEASSVERCGAAPPLQPRAAIPTVTQPSIPPSVRAYIYANIFCSHWFKHPGQEGRDNCYHTGRQDWFQGGNSLRRPKNYAVCCVYVAFDHPCYQLPTEILQFCSRRPCSRRLTRCQNFNDWYYRNWPFKI